jgi:hypothetical protein
MAARANRPDRVDRDQAARVHRAIAVARATTSGTALGGIPLAFRIHAESKTAPLKRPAFVQG